VTPRGGSIGGGGTIFVDVQAENTKNAIGINNVFTEFSLFGNTTNRNKERRSYSGISTYG
jgi:hypothetical protein